MEASSNTYVFDPEGPTEMACLITHDRVMTEAMDGPLSGIPDPLLLAFLRSEGYQQVRTLPFVLDYSAGTVAWSNTYHTIEILGYQIKPLLLKLGLITDEAFDALQQQALIQTLQRTFCALAHHTTVLGRKPIVF
jgi:hypothetical protein